MVRLRDRLPAGNTRPRILSQGFQHPPGQLRPEIRGSLRQATALSWANRSAGNRSKIVLRERGCSRAFRCRWLYDQALARENGAAAPVSVPATVRGAAVTGNVSRSLSHESKVLDKKPKKSLAAGPSTDGTSLFL